MDGVKRPRSHWQGLLAAVAAVLALFVAPAAAQAAFPGGNGKVAYLSGNDIFIAESDGGDAVNLTSSFSGIPHSDGPAVSPDGTKVAFADDDQNLYVVNSDGSNSPTAIRSQGDFNGQPAWSPNGQQLAGQEWEPGGPTNDLIVVNSTTGALVTTIASPGLGHLYSSPTWSPTDSGRLAVYYQHTEIPDIVYSIATVSTSGGTPTEVTSTTNEALRPDDPDFSPSGNQIVFGRRTGLSETGGVYSVATTGGAVTELEPTGKAPFYSPDGTKIGFHQVGSSGNGIHVMDADGSNPDEVIPSASFGSWAVGETGLTVNTAADDGDTDDQDSRCDSDDSKDGDQCTLRAAIQEANAREGADTIEFNIKKKASKVIEPQSPLPTLTEEVTIDGATQPGAASRIKPVIELSGADIPDEQGLVLEGRSSRVEALSIRSFSEGAGISLEGEGQHRLEGNWFGVDRKGKDDFVPAPNQVGVRIKSPDNVITLNEFAASGDPRAFAEYGQGLDREGTTPEDQHMENLAELGAGIHVDSGAVQTVIQGNAFGMAPGGGRIGTKALKLGDSRFAQVAGILLSPSDGGTLTNTVIGGRENHERNAFSGNVGAIMALGRDGTVANTAIRGNLIGPRGFDNRLRPNPASGVGNLLGIVAAGSVSSLEIGGLGPIPGLSLDGEGNVIGGNLAGVVAGGSGVTGIDIANNQIGADQNLKSLLKDIKADDPTLGLHNFIGVILGDTQNAQVGRVSGLGGGNAIVGNFAGLLLGGSGSQSNDVINNSFGLSQPPAKPLDKLEVGDLGGLMGLLDAESTQNVIGAPTVPNRFHGTGLGLISIKTVQEKVQANTFDKNGIGHFAVNTAGLDVGGTAAGAGNTFQRNSIGLGMVYVDPTKAQLQAADTEQPVTEKDRRKPFASPNSDLALDTAAPLVGDTDLSPEAVAPPAPQPGVDNAIQGNTFGSPSSSSLGNDLGALVLGGFTDTTFGTGSASTTTGANTIANNKYSGVVVEAEDVDLRGNSILNSNAAAKPTPRDGLGIDLIRPASSGTSSLDYGVNLNDTADPDEGGNGFQNFPTIVSATDTGGGNVAVNATLDAKAGAYSIELYASASCGEHAYGEGEGLVKRYAATVSVPGVPTDVSTTATIPANKRALTATATGPEGTSEFSQCVNVPAP
jgi:Tol biopolymer transport system component